ncbi:hypothetical protein BELL_0982g00030 [Botrytis elliptica]|uniref:Uncharacterized protein n=1 Tax=Botrytis elliptica TaxID=278938 RepID=A0A4Z1J360_9HELO|nr:hypothetical protein BELL_0982g00030 [Botrytis elliptica]
MFRGHRDVRETQVAGQNGNEPEEMNPRRRRGARDADFEEGEEGVEPVFGNVGPGVEGGGEPADGDRHPEDDAPENDGHQDGVADDAAVVEGVQGLEGARKAREEWGAAACVAEGVEGGEEEVEGYAPVAEDCGGLVWRSFWVKEGKTYW